MARYRQRDTGISEVVKMGNPFVSVIVPCYNMERYLLECLNSVLNQKLKNIEVICIDDGSRDNTGALLDQVSRSDSRVRVVHQENRGVAASRNRGIMMAEGDYVVFMDPDDFYPNDGVLELLYRKASEHHAQICGGSFSCYNEDTGLTIRCFMDDLSGYMFQKEGFVSYRDYQFDFGYHRFLYSRSFLLAHDIFFPPYTRYQDPPFFVKAMVTAGQFYAVPDVVYRYRIGIQADALTWPSAKLQDMIRGHLDVLKISAEAELGKLHALTVRRFEADNVFVPVMKSLQEGDAATKDLVLKFHASIRTDLLPKRMYSGEPGGYKLRQLNTPEGLPQGKESRLMGYCQLLCSMLRFFRKHGFRDTLVLTYEILRN